jgi:hypothetical protein
MIQFCAERCALCTGMNDAFAEVVTFAGNIANAGNGAMSLVFSRDPEVVDLVRRSCPRAWCVEVCETWGTVLAAMPKRQSVRIVLFDDEAVGEDERRARIEEIHVRFSEAFVIYVAGTHTQATERSARMGGVVCYTSKPLDAERLHLLLGSLCQTKPAPGSWRRYA